MYTENSGGTVLELGLNPNGNVNVTGSVTASDAVTMGSVNALKVQSGINAYIDSGTDAANANIFVTGAGTGDFASEAGHLVIQPRVQGTVYRDIIFASGITTADPILRLFGEGSATFSGNVGIGTSNPDTTLHLQTPSGTKSEINFAQTAVTNYRIGVPASTDALVFTYGASTERMRILADGSVCQGNTVSLVASNFNSQAGAAWHKPDGHYEIATTSNVAALQIGKNNANDGSLVVFRKQATTVGQISARSGDMVIGTGDTGLQFYDVGDAIFPLSASGNTNRDAAIDLGMSSNRFKDLHLSGTAYAGDLLVGTTSDTAKLSVYEAANNTEANPHFRITGAGYSGYHWLDATAYYIGQNSVARNLRLYSGAETAGVNLAPSGTSWGTFSDERLKYDVEPIENALESLSNLRTVKYRLTDVDAPDSQKKLGLIAQDLVGVLDEVIDPLKRTGDETEYMSVRYTEMVPVLVKAIQEQQATIEALTARIAALES